MATSPAVYVEILNTGSSAFAVTTAWTDVTVDAMSAQVNGIGFLGARRGSPNMAQLSLTMNNINGTYSPDVSGYAGNSIVENMNRIRIRAGGSTLGNCLKVSFAGGSPNGGTVNQVYTATIGAATVWTMSYQVRAQYDFIGNTDTVTLKSNLADITTTTPSYTTKWVTYTQALTISATPAASVTVQVSPGANTVGNQYIEYKNFSLTCPTVNGGLNVLTNGNFSTGLLTPWVATGTGGTTVTAAPIPDTWIIFSGLIVMSALDASLDGTRQAILTCADFLYCFTIKKLNPPPAIQRNVGTDSLVNTLLTYMQASRSTKLWPAQQIDTGILQNIDVAFDKYTSGSTQALQAIDDIVDSECGFIYFDRDGTFRFSNQRYLANKQSIAALLTLTDGYPFQLTTARDISTVINNVTVTYHPRSTTGALNALWSQGQVTAFPPGQTTTIICPFRDAYGTACGGVSVVSTLLANTDFVVTDNPVSGAGYDYTSKAGTVFTIVCTVANQAGAVQATQASIAFTNNASGVLYANTLQVRGISVTTYSPQLQTATDATSIGRYLQRDFNKDLPYVNNIAYAQSIATYMITRYKNPFLEATSFQVQNKATLNGVDLLGLEIGDQAAITASKVGLSANKHSITGLNYTLHPQAGSGLLQNFSAVLRIADPVTYLIWDVGKWDVNQWYL